MTKDLDVWIRPSRENAERARAALAAFGTPLDGLTIDDLLDVDTVFQIGVAPLRIDVLTAIDGITFDEAWETRVDVRVGDTRVTVIGPRALLANKEATGRPQDLVDAARLRKRLSEKPDA